MHFFHPSSQGASRPSGEPRGLAPAQRARLDARFALSIWQATCHSPGFGTPLASGYRKLEIAIDMPPQPTATSCGPTSLFAVYRHLGDAIAHQAVIDETHELEDGGTLAVHLGTHALTRGYRATLYTFNLALFDPTWFGDSGVDLGSKLARQAEGISPGKRLAASEAYQTFLRLGGEVRMGDVTRELLDSFIARGVPLLAGVSATYLYQSARELADGSFDDLAGSPQGHFVVAAGRRGDDVLICDPWHAHGRATPMRYWLPLHRFVHAMLLGVLTYDGNLLGIEKRHIDPRKSADGEGGA